MIKVYIAGPYGRRNGISEREIWNNVVRARYLAKTLISMGFNPFVPHLYHYIWTTWSRNAPSEDVWLKICKEWIPHCQALYRLTGESVGADNEVALARSLNIPVFYSLKELEKWAKLAPGSL